jgi:glycosyltransferase involved in cell wall biosynthesis
VVSAFRPTLLAWRYLLGPLTLNYYGPRLRWLAERIQPDLIHALRIPFEGMLASYAPANIPLAVSIWGNDLTLHASGSARMAALTRKTLRRADGLLADTNRDIRLARTWGFADGNPALLVPGSGGLELDEINSVREIVQRVGSQFDHLFPANVPLVVNPRGFRTGSVRQDTFFAAIPFILERRPGVSFACAAMAGQREALRAVERYHLENKVTLLPHLPQTDLWGLFARAAVTVSVSQHDGTPNTLLEAMALGALPVAGDIESIREWITPGVNGLLVEPNKPQALAEAVLLALDSRELCARAAEFNARQVAERASAVMVREKLRIFYEGLAACREIPV